MRTVGIVGLGLIGGSLAKAVKEFTSCEVMGFDANEDVNKAALSTGAIDGVLTESRLKECDLLIAALFPGNVIKYVIDNISAFKKGVIIVDVAGVKNRVCKELGGFCRKNEVYFIGGHPMAGVERSGFENSFPQLFNGASMILCRDEFTDETAFEKAKSFFLSLGFGGIKVTTAEEHDLVISYTSQLAHVVSNAYVKSDTLQKRYGFSAGSFKDLTRVAKLSPNMWAELFIENKENLVSEIDKVISELQKYREAIDSGDFNTTAKLLDEGSKIKIADEEEELKWKGLNM